MKSATLFLTLAVSVLPAVRLHAESWEELRGLSPGDAIQVRDDQGQQHKGSFLAASTETISLRTDHGELALERPHVRRVEVRSGQRRVRNAIIGTAIGVGIGVAVDQTLGLRLRNEGNDSGRALMYAVPIGVLGGLGALPAGYRTIYKAP